MKISSRYLLNCKNAEVILPAWCRHALLFSTISFKSFCHISWNPSKFFGSFSRLDHNCLQNDQNFSIPRAWGTFGEFYFFAKNWYFSLWVSLIHIWHRARSDENKTLSRPWSLLIKGINRYFKHSLISMDEVMVPSGTKHSQIAKFVECLPNWVFFWEFTLDFEFLFKSHSTMISGMHKFSSNELGQRSRTLHHKLWEFLNAFFQKFSFAPFQHVILGPLHILTIS